MRPSAPFDAREDARVQTNWKAVIAFLGFAALGGAAYWRLESHDKRLDKIENKVDRVLETTAEIKGRLIRNDPLAANSSP